MGGVSDIQNVLKIKNVPIILWGGVNLNLEKFQNFPDFFFDGFSYDLIEKLALSSKVEKLALSSKAFH